jgi:hypothetical protein
VPTLAASAKPCNHPDRHPPSDCHPADLSRNQFIAVHHLILILVSRRNPSLVLSSHSPLNQNQNQTAPAPVEDKLHPSFTTADSHRLQTNPDDFNLENLCRSTKRRWIVHIEAGNVLFAHFCTHPTGRRRNVASAKSSMSNSSTKR